MPAEPPSARGRRPRSPGGGSATVGPLPPGRPVPRLGRWSPHRRSDDRKLPVALDSQHNAMPPKTNCISIYLNNYINIFNWGFFFLSQLFGCWRNRPWGGIALMDNAHKTSDNVTRPKETERRARGSSPSPPPPSITSKKITGNLNPIALMKIEGRNPIEVNLFSHFIGIRWDFPIDVAFSIPFPLGPTLNQTRKQRK